VYALVAAIVYAPGGQSREAAVQDDDLDSCGTVLHRLPNVGEPEARRRPAAGLDTGLRQAQAELVIQGDLPMSHEVEQGHVGDRLECGYQQVRHVPRPWHIGEREDPVPWPPAQRARQQAL
jgi:hypothetical protein